LSGPLGSVSGRGAGSYIATGRSRKFLKESEDGGDADQDSGATQGATGFESTSIPTPENLRKAGALALRKKPRETDLPRSRLRSAPEVWDSCRRVPGFEEAQGRRQRGFRRRATAGEGSEAVAEEGRALERTSVWLACRESGARKSCRESGGASSRGRSQDRSSLESQGRTP